MFLKEICAGGVLGIYITGCEMFESPWIKAFYIIVFFTASAAALRRLL